MKVCQLSLHAPGGPEQSRTEALRTVIGRWPTLTGTAEATAAAGCDTHVLQIAIQHEDLELRSVRYFAGSAAQLFAEASRLSPDVLHIHGLRRPLFIRRVCARFPKLPVLLQDHGSVPPSGWFKTTIAAACFRPVAGVAFTAREQAEPFLQRGVFSPQLPIYEVVEGSTAFQPGDKTDARVETGLSGEPALLWVGRLIDDKDPLTVLDAVRLASADFPRLKLWLVFAGGELEAEVRLRVQRDNALRDRVHLVGPVDHEKLESYYRAADIYLSASRREGSGYALIEAMACDLTPIVSDIPSFRRIVGPERQTRCGELFPCRDAPALARKISAIGRLADRNVDVRRRFDNELSWPAIGHQLLDAYQAVVDR